FMVIDTVIRGHIGFDGLLMSDDLSMEALSGTLGERARESLSAGCDLVLHCNGKMEEMVAIAPEVPILSGDALRRSEQAISLRKSSLVPLDIDLALRQFSALTAVS
ncbi:MAG: beta-hexosaminidase, partial [Alphaproteobacteria bacterium]|nr:beta-hexosaminidase [Alphaproteobacteria bacterium]MDX5417140.1 beta-hexosaminidase [Alphaproteobacteria bacterium]MDX5494568.1 beta-hexosaminidase [Alphaproteobacteria bacterium]